MKKILFILLAACTLVGCQEKKNDVIKIGAILPLTGKYADSANGVKAGVEMAVRELNDSIGYNKYEILYYDTSSDPKLAITGYRKLRTSKKINYFITTNTDHSLAIKPLAIKDQVLLVCVASSAEITNNNNNLIFRPCNTSRDEAKSMVENLEHQDSIDRIIVYSQNNDAGLAYKKAFNQYYKGTIDYWYLYETDNNNIRNIVPITELKNEDCIVVLGFVPTMGTIIKTIKEYGYQGNIISNPGFNTPSVLNVAGNAANGVKYLDYNFPYETDVHKQREAICKKEFNISFSALSYMSLTAIKLIDRAINEIGNNDPIAVGDFLSQKDVYYKVDGAEFYTDGFGGIIPSLVLKEYNVSH